MFKIVIAEDNVVSAMELTECLNTTGCQVTGVATSGQEALELTNSIKPDLLLMEIMMPGPMDGIAAAEYIRTNCDVPILFVNGDADKAILQRARNLSCRDHIRKPFRGEDVEEAIRSVLKVSQ